MPPRKSKESAAYRVLNPRGIPEGRHILRNGEQRWYEGDSFDPARARVNATTPCDVEGQLRDGRIEEVG